MSEIYVKWNVLKASSGKIESFKNTVDSCARQTVSSGNRLHISDGVDASVKRTLAAEAERLKELASSISSYSAALADIAECYRTTEQTNTER